MEKRLLRLTPDHIARVVEDAGEIVTGPFASGRRPATDEDYLRIADDILRAAQDRNNIWVFAYGSLIWNPAFDFVERRRALARGWRRSFCLGWDKWFRGTEHRPGLMLALDRGGSCNGVAYRLPDDSIETNLLSLLRREIHVIPHSFPARWITVTVDGGTFPALTFAIDRNSGAYVGNLSVEEIADVLAKAVGRWGSMAEYLLSTVSHLEKLDLRDAYLWRLQELVAERIEASAVSGPEVRKP
ncbi:gamma-glutamylcyclotransferase [Mesorhizobium sp. KR9-304]|uniref:gamma-glutamylcyclotransferase n=1 Tax=Mesorhizobium sp. KR9-304 TaxID=3156614 RepID=UPI0032B580FF